jgi:hypothetical protein
MDKKRDDYKFLLVLVCYEQKQALAAVITVENRHMYWRNLPGLCVSPLFEMRSTVHTISFLLQNFDSAFITHPIARLFNSATLY